MVISSSPNKEIFPHCSRSRRRYSDTALLQMYVESNHLLRERILTLKKRLSCFELKDSDKNMNVHEVENKNMIEHKIEGQTMNEQRKDAELKCSVVSKVSDLSVSMKTCKFESNHDAQNRIKPREFSDVKMNDESANTVSKDMNFQSNQRNYASQISHNACSLALDDGSRINDGNNNKTKDNFNYEPENYPHWTNQAGLDYNCYNHFQDVDIESGNIITLSSNQNISSSPPSVTRHALKWMKRLITPSNTPNNGYNHGNTENHGIRDRFNHRITNEYNHDLAEEPENRLLHDMEEGILGRNMTSLPAAQVSTSDRVDIISEESRHNHINHRRNGPVTDHIWCLLERVRTVLINMYPCENNNYSVLGRYDNMV